MKEQGESETIERNELNYFATLFGQRKRPNRKKKPPPKRSPKTEKRAKLAQDGRRTQYVRETSNEKRFSTREATKCVIRTAEKVEESTTKMKETVKEMEDSIARNATRKVIDCDKFWL